MYKVRYRDPDRVDRSRMFLRRADAEELAGSVETDIAAAAAGAIVGGPISTPASLRGDSPDGSTQPN
jgi:hypothetical protein